MGRFVLANVKKWWLVALVFTLALSLTSCSRRSAEGFVADIGVGPCDSDDGSMQVDIFVRRSPAQANLFEVYAVPAYLSPDVEGQNFQFNAFNRSPAAKNLVPSVTLVTNQSYFLDYVSEDELVFYDELAITPEDPSTDFLNQETDFFVSCNFPVPGDGVDYEGQIIGSRTRSAKMRSLIRAKTGN